MMKNTAVESPSGRRKQAALDRAQAFLSGRHTRRRAALAEPLAALTREQLIEFVLRCADFADEFDVVFELQAAEKTQHLAEVVRSSAPGLRDKRLRAAAIEMLSGFAAQNFEDTIAPPVFPSIAPVPSQAEQ